MNEYNNLKAIDIKRQIKKGKDVLEIITLLCEQFIDNNEHTDYDAKVIFALMKLNDDYNDFTNKFNNLISELNNEG